MLLKSKNAVILAFFAVFPLFSIAQKGFIRGTIFDDVSGESVIGASIQVAETSLGAVSDLDGKFSISIDPGTYTVRISMISYQQVVIEGVVVRSGEATILDNIRLKEDVQTLEAVVVSSEALRNSETSIMSLKRKSANVMDGISADKFRRVGDSDASEAIKRVTGVSVEGGKYVYVRGLGDRYTKTTLNDVDIPGLDPDRNSIQIDIFPTSLIDNMMVLKSSVSEMPADFTGGVVNIETKDFPDEKVFNVSASIGYNPSMHLRNDYFMYQGGKTDWLGVDDGTRALPPGALAEPYPAPGTPGVSPQDVNQYLKGFNKDLAATNQTSFMDFNFGLSSANQKNFANGNSLGYVFSLAYKSSTLFYDDVIFGEYQRPAFPDEYEMVYATVQTGSVTERNVLLGGLAGLAYKTQRSKYKLTVLHLQNGEKRAAKLFIDDNGSAVGKSGFTGFTDNLEFSERGVTNFLLNGQHRNNNGSFSVDWKISPTISKIDEPDIRKTAFTYTSSDTVFSPGAAGYPSRIWRYLDEINLVGKVDFKKEHKVFGRNAILKFGVSQVFKERDYSILTYNMQFFGTVPEFNGDPTVVMNDEYLYPDGSVYFSNGNPNPNSNEYNSTVSNSAFHISEQFLVAEKLKLILGIRGEKFLQRHTGRDAIYAGGDIQNGNNLDNAIVLDAFDLFPSANVVYSFNDSRNLRLSYSRTIARPSFKELSFAQILDPVSNRIFNGGLFRYSDWDGNLRETYIDNLDLRWEYFMPLGDLISIGAFYKKFTDPIELVRIPEAQTTNEFQPRNVGDGQLYGIEVEFRKSLGFLSHSMNNLFLSGNVTLVQSSIEMTDREYNARKGYEKEGESIDNKREMAGQAPYMINFGLSYENNSNGIDGGFFYNVNGPTLTVVGGGLFPDVFSEPFHSLNFNMNKAIGKERKSTLTFNVSNILNDVRENFFNAYNAERQYYSRFGPGVSVSFGIRFNL